MKVLDVIGESQVTESRGDADTIRLWETYRDQAILWRSMAILQIPATFIALLFALFVWNGRTQVINVPQKPLPGFHEVGEIPDDEFINSATEYINLVSTYTTANARRQFREAMDLIREPMLTQFQKEMMEDELRVIESSQRTQLFFVDPTKTIVRRETPRVVAVWLMGERSKFIAGRELRPSNTVYKVLMTTVPRNKINPYGIMITSVESDPDVRNLSEYHRKFIKDEKKTARKANQK
jgi:hypothetical protein